MADPGMSNLGDRAAEFFSTLDFTPAAAVPIAPYPLELRITTPEERFDIAFRDGRPGEVTEVSRDAGPGHWTLELRADQRVFEGIFAGALTMGEAMYAGLLVAPEEKSKHNLSCAIGPAIRLVQEARRRAGDPREPNAKG
ncbi:hypothetical protein [Amycolatopsis pithecellobii]|uniref:SCP2 domain-containing protein n=1 Tax=Amycolatopsis pithecellobii TaxID=664692 RepID=A0A6N7YKK0_9PSEU|nr:hypothetical protein [Amycolatopsis pithecellobii]MTD52542.1 hypothetical protein [Amycolatopsis pithecellobii]